MFEVVKSDLRGRIGTLYTNHGRVETPAYVPVIHPVRQTIPSKKIREMGFDMVITNAYITRNSYGDDAVRRGIHSVIDFDGAVMTDSGGYQVLEYGGVDVTPQDMAEFERGIRADIAIPLDRPTGFGLSKRKAGAFVRHTLKVSRETLEQSEDNGQIWAGPIQGGEHTELVRRSARSLAGMGFSMLALGSPVEFMESYEYRLLAQMIIAAKEHIPHSVPLHLFGAGHPLTIPFSVALGCDTFDSASYMLYAKQGRYITEDGTRRIGDIMVFPCDCEVCSRYTPGELGRADSPERIDGIATHNLHAIKNEVDRVRQAIHEGRLWEYVIKKARAHPRLFEVIGAFTGNADFFVQTTPKFKERAIFLCDKADQFRPEVRHYQGIAGDFRSKKKRLLVTRESAVKPAYLSAEYAGLKDRFGDLGEIQVCQYSPHLGVIPLEISDVFPAAHHETARVDFDPRDFPMFEKAWVRFFENNGFSEVYYDKDDAFLRHFMKKIPSSVRKRQLK